MTVGVVVDVGVGVGVSEPIKNAVLHLIVEEAPPAPCNDVLTPPYGAVLSILYT